MRGVEKEAGTSTELDGLYADRAGNQGVIGRAARASGKARAVEKMQPGIPVRGEARRSGRPHTLLSINQLRVPAGGLGDFFGPGTTVGIPFAAQLGVRVTF